jgi:methyl-accepting chemotaxis protein
MRNIDRISVRLNLTFAVLVTLLLAAFGVFSYFSSKTAMEADLNAQVERAVERLKIGLPDPLWNFDLKRLDLVLESESNAPGVAGIVITNDKNAFVAGRLHGEDGKIVAASATSQPHGTPLVAKVQFDDAGQLKGVGTVTVFVSREHIDAMLSKQVVAILIQMLLANLILLASLSLSLKSIVLNPLNRVREALATISSGDADLTRRLEVGQNNEIGEIAIHFNAFVTQLEAMIKNVRGSAEALNTSCAEIAQGNNDLSVRTEQQASALQETSTSMEELGSTVSQNAERAGLANRLAMTASEVAVRGGGVMGNMVHTMKDINDSSRKISDIIQVIDGIAFQTNILALNAAVEAARAGEQGRGFAVVASEVRSLAGRSASAAKEIKSLINASVERVEQGNILVNQAGTTMTEVVDAISQVTTIMGEISSASGEQSTGVHQVGDAVANMDRTTQQNAALVEEMAASAASLENLANSLVSTVSSFRVSQTGEQRLLLSSNDV